MPGIKKVASRKNPPVEYDLNADVIRLNDLRGKVKVATEEIAEIQDRITAAMATSQQTTVVVRNGDDVHKVTYMQTPRRTIDEAKLKRKVGPSIWRRITTLSLDRKKAEALVSTGEIDPVDYADCIIETLSAPFVKVT